MISSIRYEGEGVGDSAPSNHDISDKFNDIDYDENETIRTTNNNREIINDSSNRTTRSKARRDKGLLEETITPDSSKLLQEHNNNSTSDNIISSTTNSSSNTNITPIATVKNTNRRTTLSALSISSSSLYLTHDHREIIKYHNSYHTMLLLQDIIPTTTSVESTSPSFGSVVSLVSSVEHKALRPDDSEKNPKDNDIDEDSDVTNEKLLDYLDFPFNYQVMIQGKDSFPLTALTELSTAIVTPKILTAAPSQPSEDNGSNVLQTAGPSSRPNSPSAIQYVLVLSQTPFPHAPSDPRRLVLYFSQRGTMRKWQKKLMDVLLDLVTIACLKRTHILLCVHNFSALFYYSLLSDITQTLDKITQLFYRNYTSDITETDARQKSVRRYLTHFLKNHYFLTIYLDIVQVIRALLLSTDSANETVKDDKGLNDVMYEVIESVAVLSVESYFNHHSPYHHLLRLAQLTPSSKAAANRGEKQRREEAERLWQLKALVPDDQRKKVEEEYLTSIQLFLQSLPSIEEVKDNKRIKFFSQQLITAGGTVSEASLASSSLDAFAESKTPPDQITPSSIASSAVDGKKQRRIIRFHGLKVLPNGETDNVSRVTSAPASVIGSQTNSPDRAQGAAQIPTNTFNEEKDKEKDEAVKEVLPPSFPTMEVTLDETFSEKVHSPSRSPPKANDSSASSSGRTTTPSTPPLTSPQKPLSMLDHLDDSEKRREQKNIRVLEEVVEVDAQIGQTPSHRLDWLKYLIIAVALTMLCFNLNSPASHRPVITLSPSSALVPSTSSSCCTPSSAIVYLSRDSSALVKVGGLECEAIQSCERTDADLSEALVTFMSPTSSDKNQKERGGTGDAQLQRRRLKISHIVQRFVQSIQRFLLKVFRRQ